MKQNNVSSSSISLNPPSKGAKARRTHELNLNKNQQSYTKINNNLAFLKSQPVNSISETKFTGEKHDANITYFNYSSSALNLIKNNEQYDGAEVSTTSSTKHLKFTTNYTEKPIQNSTQYMDASTILPTNSTLNQSFPTSTTETMSYNLKFKYKNQSSTDTKCTRSNQTYKQRTKLNTKAPKINKQKPINKNDRSTSQFQKLHINNSHGTDIQKEHMSKTSLNLHASQRTYACNCNHIHAFKYLTQLFRYKMFVFKLTFLALLHMFLHASKPHILNTYSHLINTSKSMPSISKTAH